MADGGDVPVQGDVGGPGPRGRAIEFEDIGPLQRLVSFDLRNGRPGDAVSLLVKPTIPLSYYWQPIANMPARNAIAHTHAYIRQTLRYLTTNPPANYSAAQIRKQAIIIGTARAVMTELYSIEAADLIVGETAVSTMEAVLEEGRPVAVNAVTTVDAETVAALRTPLALTETERQAVAAIHMSAIGLLPLQGYSLIMTGHHYLSDGDNQSKRAFTVVERQFWAGSGVREWWTADETICRDAMWHKAAHPVSLSLKRQLAQNDHIPGMLEVAGAGVAASRLPAMEPEMRRAGSYRTLMKTVRPLFETFGGELNFELFTDAMDTVRLFSTVAPTEGPSRGPALPRNIPSSVVDRQTAIAFLADVCERNADIVAFCYGFYVQLSERAALTGTNMGPDTLRNAYSLKSLRNQSLASFTQGAESYGDYAAARSQARAAGRFIPPKFNCE